MSSVLRGTLCALLFASFVSASLRPLDAGDWSRDSVVAVVPSDESTVVAVPERATPEPAAPLIRPERAVPLSIATLSARPTPSVAVADRPGAGPTDVASTQAFAPWLRTTRETAFWSGPDSEAQEFVKAPEGTIVRPIEGRGPRTLVFFGGDTERRRAGEVWVDTADLLATAWPRWIRSRRSSTIRSRPDNGSPPAAALRRGTYVEIIGEQTGRWARAFYLGDGQTAGPVEGWVQANDFALPATPQEKLATVALTRAMLLQSPPELWLRVPYRTQIDGSPYADANCGPTTVAMALEAFGQSLDSGRVRAVALELQGTPDCDSCGLFIEYLAEAAEARGLPTYGLRDASQQLRHWSIDDIRTELRAGHVVVPQVDFRSLPGRNSSAYWGDHYILVTGIHGDHFIYNDPIDSDGTGYGRVISAEALSQAMERSDFPQAAFAAGR